MNCTSSRPVRQRRAKAGGPSLWIPAGFDPERHLDPELVRYADPARYVLNAIVWREIFDKRIGDAWDGFVPLKSEILRRYFPADSLFHKVRDSMTRNGAIETDGRYIVGEKSIGYRLGPDLAGSSIEMVPITDRTLARKVADWRASEIKAPKAVHRHLLRNLRRVEIDYPAALEWLTEQDWRDDHDFVCAEASVRMIRDKEFRFRVCEHGRVHTNLTNLRSGLRPFLTAGGRRLVNLDIRNSQPLLFTILLPPGAPRGRDREAPGGTGPAGRGSGGTPGKTPYHYDASLRLFSGRKSMSPLPQPDVSMYTRLCEEGRFYDYLMEQGGVPPGERSKFKIKFFGRVFFCENDPVLPAARTFGELFPNVYAAIRAMKSEDYTALAKRLQRAESDLMIGKVARRCMAELPDAFIGTIHDSILTTPDMADPIRAIMVEEFREIGLSPTIRVEDYSE